MPQAGARTFSFIRTEGFLSTVNSTIIATQNVYFSKIPNGCPPGNGAIFFLYVCDSSDIGGNNGNFGVGIDGSGVWSLWIGGNLTYNYVFQTEGALPVSNTWYHVVLTVDNSAGKATLTVNGIVVIASDQQQFTDGNHYVSLMSGMGENWWSDGTGEQEAAVGNVSLEISDASSEPSSSVTYLPSHPIPTAKESPHPTALKPTPSPSLNPQTTPDIPELPIPISITLLMLVISILYIKTKQPKHSNQSL